MNALQPLPITPLGRGVYQLGEQRITTTFHQVANVMPHKGPALDDPPLPIRKALINSLRDRITSQDTDDDPWQPTGPTYHPFRGSIEPLIGHYLWQQGQVLASPFTLYLPHRDIAGSADAVLRLPDATTAVVTLVYAEPKPLLKHRVTTLLGGLIAAAIDTKAFTPAHGIALWVSCGQTLVESFAPDLCLGRWVETYDCFRAGYFRPVHNGPQTQFAPFTVGNTSGAISTEKGRG